jgi:hypothetical protein
VEWLQRGAAAVAVGRVGLGLVALTCPAVVARPWVGPSAESQAGQVLGRALGGRDLALGLGTLAALRRAGAGPDQGATAWVGLSALADGFDLLITAGSWGKLPTPGRWLVALASGGAAALGLAAAAAAGGFAHPVVVSGRGERAGAPQRKDEVRPFPQGGVPVLGSGSFVRFYHRLPGLNRRARAER